MQAQVHSVSDSCHGRGEGACVGFVMLDVVVSMGFAAMVISLAMMLLTAAGESQRASRLATTGLWVVPLCLDDFEAEEKDCVFAVGADEVFGPVDQETYVHGLREDADQRIRYLCRVVVDDRVNDNDADGAELRSVVVSIEEPAWAAVGNRRKLKFYTMMK